MNQRKPLLEITIAGANRSVVYATTTMNAALPSETHVRMAGTCRRGLRSPAGHRFLSAALANLTPSGDALIVHYGEQQSQVRASATLKA
jgi:hypothetical protein